MVPSDLFQPPLLLCVLPLPAQTRVTSKIHRKRTGPTCDEGGSVQADRLLIQVRSSLEKVGGGGEAKAGLLGGVDEGEEQGADVAS